ncbi:MAG TPA: 4-hydroxythreonine-4-phosphate dehydrogenase PdxA [Alteraurantiacibacter sp.]
MSTPLAVLAVTLGDPAGIAPELACAAWAAKDSENLPPFAVAGGAAILKDAGIRRGLDMPVHAVTCLAEAADVFPEALPVLSGPDGTYRPGEPNSDGARIALASLEAGTALAISGEASGVVTGPIDKARLAEVGFAFPGQTEFLAERCGIAAGDAVMMLAGPSLRAAPITVHVALLQVPTLLTADLICNRTRIVAEALKRDFGIPNPRIAIAALNPHAGEQGLMGDEEERVIAPAIAALHAAGIDASGPHAADSLFAPRARETYDAAIAMYHDQALIPLKALDFDEGVNITLGLPIVRTSPDHGTAFGIAGKGMADPGAMIAAIRMAGEIAARRAAA